MYSNSMISTLISLSSTETENLDCHEKDGNDLLEDIDLELSFEDMSDSDRPTFARKAQHLLLQLV